MLKQEQKTHKGKSHKNKQTNNKGIYIYVNVYMYIYNDIYQNHKKQTYKKQNTKIT